MSVESLHGSLLPRVIAHNNGQYSECNDQLVDVAGFSSVSPISIVDDFFDLNSIAGIGGITSAQSAGSAVIVSNTTSNAEYLIRSKNSYSGSMRLKASVILSQRIVNNNFAILLADFVGERLAYNIFSTTAVDIIIPGEKIKANMIGQFINIGGLSSVGVPGRYAVASVTGDVVRFTVSGWPASGSGTCTVFGRNYVRNLFTGTTATNVNWDVQRNGWAAGDTVATINTTASPGTIVISELTGREAFLLDKLRASATAPTATLRASRDENIPDQDIELYAFLWAFNGSTAPASNTTWTIGHLSVEMYANVPLYIQGFRATGGANPLGVTVVGTPAVSLTSTTISGGQGAHDAPIAGNPIRTAGRGVTANYSAVVNNETADFITTTVGAQIMKPYAIPELEWSFTAALTTTTPVVVQTAAGVGLKRHITWFQATNTGATANDVLLQDDITTRLQITIPAGQSVAFALPTGIPVTANTALNVALLAAGTVRVNILGYTAT